MPYKILLIIVPAFDPNAGGVQRSTFKMASYFKSFGNDVHVFSFAHKGHLKQTVADLHFPNNTGLHRSRDNHEHLLKVVKYIKPDIVINQRPYNFEIGKTLKSICKNQSFLLIACLRNTLFTVKYNIENYLVNNTHRFLTPFFELNWIQNIFFQVHKVKHSFQLRSMLDTYDYFVMFGPPNLEELKYFVGDYKLHKTHLIPNSILHVESSIPRKEKRILWLSRLSYGQKRADLILPFWKKVMQELPDWELDIVGDGNAYEDLKNQIQAENIPRVHLYGKQVPDAFYKRSPIYIMTSKNEGFPNTLIEAQAYACVPVVFNNYPICSWVVKNGDCGILIPPFEVETMANEVIKLAKDTNTRELLMQKALQNANEFHIDNVGEKWLSFFDQKLIKNNF